MTALPTPKNAPQARAVTATHSRSWPVSEFVAAMMMSVLLHIAWFTFFLATAGFRPEPPWVVFPADPEAVDEVIIGAPVQRAAPGRTNSPLLATPKITPPQ